ncbi:MAG: zinc-ribbon domain-containing protein [Clostridia bacterium]|nr:zinc-ribbon domain-containing protein [Clostridia bacterium]
MFCHKCGIKISDDAKFCMSCGAKTIGFITENKAESESSPALQKIQMKCSACNGEMIIDENRKFLSCPYCGSKELFYDKSEIEIAEIKAKTYRDIETNRQNNRRDIAVSCANTLNNAVDSIKKASISRHNASIIKKERNAEIQRLKTERQRMKMTDYKQRSKNFKALISEISGVIMFIALMAYLAYVNGYLG